MTAPSLRARLTWLIILVQVIVLIPLGVLSYQREQHEMNRLLDGRLAQAGRTLGTLIAYNEKGYTDEDAHHALQLATDAQRGTVVVAVHPKSYEPEVGFQAYDAHGVLIAATANLADLPTPHADERGFSDIEHKGANWRLFTLTNRFDLTIRIGERAENRSEITRSLILEHSLPLVIGLPLLAILASLAVRQGLRPLDKLTRLLAARAPRSRTPIALERSPDEIKPLVAALNQQLERLEDALEREHRFAGDVAHELRTPLAATMIHLESALIASDADELGFTLNKARRSLGRLGRRIEQILAIARLEAGAAADQRVSLDLVSLATEVVEEFALLIGEKDISLSLTHEEPELRVIGHEVALTAMLRNLLENALRHTPERSGVDIDIHRDDRTIVITVCDDGPGISPDLRDLVFHRFQRGAQDKAMGYGLGLSIVQRAIELHDGQIALLDGPPGRGLLVRIRLEATS
ncbi:ATP-binding protein [Luteibacter aegosomatissinici]|uniref:ATP-binding protein n=1 Tax=Luteibacter aegosomatissinici TaxID=2911539 RepID=UPI001FFC2A15|nr:ATP-binding protein [Luteibacter aegosomatissinici]UPG96092.1 ATP-binding protein [Luteibacter aegosomatissinici]